MLTLLGPSGCGKTTTLRSSRCFRKDSSSRQKGASVWCSKTMPSGRT
jgi:ABC-type lipoprotein export system ATPase subunit